MSLPQGHGVPLVPCETCGRVIRRGFECRNCHADNSARMRGITAHRAGQSFEDLIDYSNEVYKAKQWALVNKRPAPVVISKKHTGGRITGRLDKKSTVDYEGLIQGGRSVQFEAKSTKVKTRLDLGMFEEHQIEHLRRTKHLGGLAFALVEFRALDEVRLVPSGLLLDCWDTWKRGGRASLEFPYVRELCHVVSSGRGVPVDYLKIVDEIASRNA